MSHELAVITASESPEMDHPDEELGNFRGLEISDISYGICYQRPSSAALPISIRNNVSEIRSGCFNDGGLV
jgi:hypothetical protein